MSNSEIIKKHIESDVSLKELFESHQFKNSALMAGNGLTRLALVNSPSWYQWVERLWGEIDPAIPFDYVTMRDVSLPECINYLHKQTENDKEKQKSIYKLLWKSTEKAPIPADINKEPHNLEMDLRFHAFCVEHFKIIFTTNYDTLFERTCKKLNFNVEIFEFLPERVNKKPYKLKFGDKQSPTITLVKLHGTFPFNHITSSDIPTEKVFNTWYDDGGPEKIVAGVKQYEKAYKYNMEKIDEFEEEVNFSKYIRSLLFLGYGMRSEDDIVVQISKKYAHLGQIAMTYGGDAIDHMRYETNWGISHLSMPAELGGGKDARMQAHFDFTRFLLKKGAGQSPPDVSPRGIMVGQCNYVNVVRTAEPPAQERSYKITKGPFSPHKKTTEKLYEIGYVAGQILTPAIFLDRWDVKTSIASFIGYDYYGLKIRNHLMRNPNINWKYVIQDKRIVTDHSSVVTHGEFRTLFDSGDQSKFGSDKIKEVFGTISKEIDEKTIIPSFIYLSKWYLEEVSHDKFLREWIASGNNPLVCYETGSKGSDITKSGEEFFLEKEIGKYCDVMLASSLYVMRVFRMPILQKGRIITNLGKHTLKEYDKLYTGGSPEGYTNRAHQNLSFVTGLWEISSGGSDMSKVINTFFNSKKLQNEFPNVSWWIVTLGDLGMVAFSRDKDTKNHQAWWIKAPEISDKNEIVNALGCGDSSRAGFLGYYINSIFNRNFQASDYHKTKYFLNNHAEVLNAVKCAVYVGTEKIKYFHLEDAVRDLLWEDVNTQSKKIEIFSLHNKRNLDRLYKLALSGP